MNSVSHLHIQSEWPTWSTWPATQTSLYERLQQLAVLASWHRLTTHTIHTAPSQYTHNDTIKR